MRRSLALALLISALSGPGIVAQVLDDALVPGGRVRLQMFPSYTRWDSRFGRTDMGETAREELGEDLTTSSAETLFPGSASLTTAIASLSGMPGYSPVLGETLGRVTKDVTRVDFGVHIGVFDWLTVGAVLPWLRTRTNVDVAFRPDTVGGDLGLNPVATDPTAVSAFLAAVSDAQADAAAYASQACASSPGSPTCMDAQALADRTSAFHSSAQTAYDATAFFPIEGSATATSLSQATSTLDADLVAAGLAGIGVPMAFATQWVEPEQFASISSTPGFGVEGAPLGSVRSVWSAGDVEVSASVRLLEGAVRDSAAAPPRLTYRIIGTALGRLPTGEADDPDVFLDVGWGDGQTDLEGRLLAQLTIGNHLGIQGAARYGVQMSRTLVRRVAPPEMVLAPSSSRHLVEWSPGSYFGVEVAPVFRLTGELSLAGEYRLFRKGRDSYELTGTSVGAPVDPVVLELESGTTLHEVGGTLRYDTRARWLAEGSPSPLQLHMRVVRAVAGRGGQTPVTTRVEFGVRVFRRFWGRP